MRRRDMLTTAYGALLVSVVPAVAEQSRGLSRVGYLFSFAAAEGEHLWKACVSGLTSLGYTPGRNVLLEPRWAEGAHSLLPDLVRQLVASRVNVIVAAATPAALATKSGAPRIPMVFVAVADPIGVGLVQSFARPGGNATGVSLLTPELSGKRVQLLAEVLKRMPSLATLSNPANRSHIVFLEETRTAASQLRAEIQPLSARDAAQIDLAFKSAAEQGVSGLVVFDDPVLWSHRRRVVALAKTLRIPVMYGYSEYVEEGGLISYGPYRPALYERTAAFVDKILNGANPAGLPVEQPTRFELMVNLGAAKELGIQVPESVVIAADRVIE